ncbi:hypothetical protein CROQUDRAFT_72560 [Cronartium quercuum f. sp. fusiforme G11]|uniref:Tyrosinase copper-binding domain-containing protein n=1 Tax=Cronartium quercuum f. sp. fusiforme G11 TaxID=708437 RepID=A0A9P6NP50_9BASI|nr:hypothetical protein CROQUDRAFT_72560 [Cronartium quercuum f. sp. fusiforme G11]
MKSVFQKLLFLAVISFTLCRPSSSRLAKRNEKFCPNPAVRVSWYSLPAAEKKAYQDSLMCLLTAPTKMKYPGAVTRYDDLVAVHQLQSDYPNKRDTLHVTAVFLHWHRLYLLLFELLMRVECGYTGRMAYWDEKVDAGNFRNARILQEFGGIGNENGYVVDGRFGYTVVNLGPGSQNVRRYLRRDLNETASAYASQEHYDLLMSQTSAADFIRYMRLFQHLAGHVGVGGEMGDVQTAPTDPIFFKHHMYVDYLWAKWQSVDPANRMFDLRNAGYTTQTPPFKTANWQSPLTFLGLADDVPMYSSADTTGGFLCYVYE